MDMLREQEDYEIRWRTRTVERLQERLTQGERYVEMPIEEVQQLLLQNIGLLQRLNRVEKELLICYHPWNQPIMLATSKETK